MVRPPEIFWSKGAGDAIIRQLQGSRQDELFGDFSRAMLETRLLPSCITVRVCG
jgi:hypothetical protein